MIKTVSLETAKLLKENGFRQDTLYVWGKRKNPISRNFYDPDLFIYQENGLQIIASAPTTDELLEEISNENIAQYVDHCNDNYFCGTMTLMRDVNQLAKCWIFLKKIGLNGRS